MKECSIRNWILEFVLFPDLSDTGRTVNPNNRLLSNTSIRGSVSLSRPDYERSNYPGWKKRPPVEGVSEEDFRKGFKNWCKKYGCIFSSEGEKKYMFKWFCDNHRYGRKFYYGGAPPIAHGDLIDHIRKFGDSESQEAKEDLLEKSRNIELDQDEDQEEEKVFYSNELPWDELDKCHLKKCCCSGRYNGSEVFYSNKLSWDEHNEYQEKRCCPCCYIGSDQLPDFERGTLFLYNNGDPIIIIMKD